MSSNCRSPFIASSRRCPYYEGAYRCEGTLEFYGSPAWLGTAPALGSTNNGSYEQHFRCSECGRIWEFHWSWREVKEGEVE